MLLLDRPVAAPARTGERRMTYIVLAVALLATVGLRLLYLGFPLGIDEGGVAFIAKAWGTGHGSLYGAYWLDRPPLLVALYKLAVTAAAIATPMTSGSESLPAPASTPAVSSAVSPGRGSPADSPKMRPKTTG